MNNKEKIERKRVIDKVTRTEKGNIFIMDSKYWSGMGTKALTEYVKAIIYSAYLLGVVDENEENRSGGGQ